MNHVFEATQSDPRTPSKADLEHIGDGKSHREAYPEQYSHRRVGEIVRVMRDDKEVTRGKIDRVVNSPDGLLCALDDMTDTLWALSDCIKDGS